MHCSRSYGEGQQEVRNNEDKRSVSGRHLTDLRFSDRGHKESHRGRRPLCLSDIPRLMVLRESDSFPEITVGRIHLIIGDRAGMVVPLYSPSAQTLSARAWPVRSCKGRRGQYLRQEPTGCSRVVLDVHPRVCGRVADGSEAAEDHRVNGKVKKADRLTGRGPSLAGLSGCKTDTGPQKPRSKYRSRRNTPRRSSGRVRLLPSNWRTGMRSVSVPHPIWHAGGY